MKTVIYCEPIEKGIHSFYLIHEGEKYLLFTQKYRKGVNDYYRKGVSMNEALNCSRAHKDGAILRTMEKLPVYIKYLEKEFSIEVLEKTKRKKHCHTPALRYS